jgi:hypothetical protein
VLTPLIAHVTEQLGATAGPQRSIVVMTRPNDAADLRDDLMDAVRAAVAAGIHLNGIGGGDYLGSLPSAVARTGGVFAYVDDPAQLPVVFRNLNSLLTRTVAFNRVRVEMRAAAGAFAPGRTVFSTLSVRIGPDTKLVWDIQIPI